MSDSIKAQEAQAVAQKSRLREFLEMLWNALKTIVGFVFGSQGPSQEELARQQEQATAARVAEDLEMAKKNIEAAKKLDESCRQRREADAAAKKAAEPVEMFSVKKVHLLGAESCTVEFETVSRQRVFVPLKLDANGRVDLKQEEPPALKKLLNLVRPDLRADVYLQLVNGINHEIEIQRAAEQSRRRGFAATRQSGVDEYVAPKTLRLGVR